MLSVEAAGNNEPPSRTNGLQVRREAQGFRRRDVKNDALMTVSKQGNGSLSDDGRKSKRIASLSSKAAGFLQPFFKQSDEPPASRKSSVSKVSAEADVFNN